MSTYYEGPTYGISDRQQAMAVDVCHKCQGELYGGENVFLMNGKTMCKECFKDWVLKFLDTSPNMLSDLLGVQMKIV